MAKRVQAQSQEPSAAQAAEDLSVLMPDQIIPLAGQQITVREYPFMTWLKLKPICGPVIADFADFLSRGDDIELDELLESFENHFQIMQKLYAESIQQPIEFLESLKDDEMTLLMVTWWSVNKHFFLKSASRLLRTLQKPPDGVTSFSP